jgi:protein SCO1/2
MLRRIRLVSWAALGLLLAGTAAVWVWRSTRPAEPPLVYAQLPAFNLVDQNGDPFGLDRLTDRVAVVNFIFTSCATVCPALTARMHDIQTETAAADAIQLVSISVDPVRDTPERLRRYGEQYGADPAKWSFLTGPLDAIEETVQKGFFMTMQPQQPDATGFFDIVHGERFVVVDRRGRIRGYFDADDAGMRELLKTARRLVDETARDDAGSPAVVSQSR